MQITFVGSLWAPPYFSGSLDPSTQEQTQVICMTDTQPETIKAQALSIIVD